MRIIEPNVFALRSTSAAILMVLALWAKPARAQLVVSDGPVETNTTIIASTLSGVSSQQLPAIIAQDTLTAQSLTTPGGAGRFQSQLSYLNSLMETMGSGIANAQIFAATYPGWIDFGANAAATAAKITNQTLTSYADAISVAQAQAANFSREDAHFQALEACNAASVSVLQAIQCGNEINLAAAQQTQQLRQLEITHIMVDAVHFGEKLNEDAQLGANAQTYFLTGAQR
jgi:conjugal transfer/entry exclusion protein